MAEKKIHFISNWGMCRHGEASKQRESWLICKMCKSSFPFYKEKSSNRISYAKSKNEQKLNTVLELLRKVLKIRYRL